MGAELVDGAEVADLGVQRLVHIEEQIAQAEDRGLRARWEFGHQLLAERDGKGRLPNGFMRDVAERTGASRAELTYRMQFAERFPTEDELLTAVNSFGSWTEVREKALKKARDAEANEPTPPPPVPEGQFATIVADPPWSYGNTSTRGAAENHYGTMTIDDLCALEVDGEPVDGRAAEQSHLYLWTTAGHLPEAFAVMDAWGFTYKTYLVWVKPQMGMGNYFRVSTELVLFGVKGGLRTQDRAVRNHFEAKRAKHSAKPREFRQLVMRASPGPYLELFARCRRDRELACDCARCEDGWTVWGDQT